MARVTLPAGMKCISGRLGDVCFRTMKATGKTVVSRMPQARKSVPSAAEMASRERFALMAKTVNQMRRTGSKKSVKELWQIVKKAYDTAN